MLKNKNIFIWRHDGEDVIFMTQKKMWSSSWENTFTSFVSMCADKIK